MFCIPLTRRYLYRCIHRPKGAAFAGSYPPPGPTFLSEFPNLFYQRASEQWFLTDQKPAKAGRKWIRYCGCYSYLSSFSAEGQHICYGKCCKAMFLVKIGPGKTHWLFFLWQILLYRCKDQK